MEERTFNEEDVEEFLNSKEIKNLLNNLGISEDFEVIDILNTVQFARDSVMNDMSVQDDEDENSIDNGLPFSIKMHRVVLPRLINPLAYAAEPDKEFNPIDRNGIYYLKFANTNIIACVSDLEFVLYNIDSNNPLLYKNDSKYKGAHFYLTVAWQNFIVNTFSSDRKKNIVNELEKNNDFFYQKFLEKKAEYKKNLSIINSFERLILNKKSYPKPTKKIISKKGCPFDVNFVLGFLNVNKAYAQLPNDIELDDQGFCTNDYLSNDPNLSLFNVKDLPPFFYKMDANENLDNKFEMFKFYSNDYEIYAFYSNYQCVLRINDKTIDISSNWRQHIVNNANFHQINIVREELSKSKEVIKKLYEDQVPNLSYTFLEYKQNTYEYIEKLKGTDQKANDKKNPR